MLSDLIARYRGRAEADAFDRFRIADLQLICETGLELLNNTPVWFGACAAMSAGWAALLRDRHNIPAVVVAGDLIIQKATIFLCEENIPESTDESGSIRPWNGHCWVESDGYVGDISIFRTARTIQRPSRLKAFIEEHFSLQGGLMLSERENLERMGMNYNPKYVLTESQINALIAGMQHQVEHGS